MDMPTIETTPTHEWLLGLVGEWTVSWRDESGAMVESGTEVVSALGTSWILMRGEAHGDVNLFQFGFDPAKGRVVGSFICTAMQHLWIYDGEVVGNKMICTSMGPRFDGQPGECLYRDTFELVDANNRTLTSHALQEDGTWMEFMFSTHRRVS